MSNTSSVILNIFLILIIVWVVLLVISLVTLSKRKDLLMPVKAFWGAIIFMAPVVGLIIYLIYGFRRNKGNGITRY